MRRVVVVGHGMVGSRFAEELLRLAPGTHLTVLGAEEYEPYNRVLLSEVVAGGVDVASLTLTTAEVPTGRVVKGSTVVWLDRERRTVLADDGARHPYDVLVLATGARARIPDITGLGVDAAHEGAGRLPAGVHALRTLDDAREIVAATVNARRAVVLGGGVLGLEVAAGLTRRGVGVTVVHAGPHLMDRQLDAGAAAAVVHGLDRIGVDHRVAAVTEEVLLHDGALRGVRLRGVRLRGATGPDGEVLAADLLVLTAGTVPETALAARAGLDVRRGIVVDHGCATADPAVFAIGDCAEPPEGGSGLIAQGWDQARRLAARLAAEPAENAEPSKGPTASDNTPPAPAPAPGTDVVRVKAHGLEIVAMGLSGPGAATPEAGTRSVRLSDPVVGRHVEVLVRDGVIVGATAVGAGQVGVNLVTAYSRRTPAPIDPAQLLLAPVAGAGDAGPEPSPTLMPDRATVCRCNGVTKGDIVACWRHGARTVGDVSRETRATTGCGGCADAVCGIVEWLERSDPRPAAATGPTIAARDGDGSHDDQADQDVDHSRAVRPVGAPA